MPPLTQVLYGLVGRAPGKNDFVIVFSARLDETGTNGVSPYVVVAGAVATADQWDALEMRWQRLLQNSRVPAYHYDEFMDGSPPFAGWSPFKRKRFVEKQEQIISKNTLFRVSIGVDHAAHKRIKEKMRGIRGFTADSDYGLCLRYLMAKTSEQLLAHDENHRLTIMIEDGPWSTSAASTYQSVVSGKLKPPKHAHRLAGFASVPKGERPSLEAADYIAGTELDRMVAGRRPNVQTLSHLLTARDLEFWYTEMIKEKEARRAWHARHALKETEPKKGRSSRH